MVGYEKMLRIIVAVNNDFTQGIMYMYILASFTYKMLQELSKQAEMIPIPMHKKLNEKWTWQW